MSEAIGTVAPGLARLRRLRPRGGYWTRTASSISLVSNSCAKSISGGPPTKDPCRAILARIRERDRPFSARESLVERVFEAEPSAQDSATQPIFLAVLVGPMIELKLNLHALARQTVALPRMTLAGARATPCPLSISTSERTPRSRPTPLLLFYRESVYAT
jgi:hypothetical protein